MVFSNLEISCRFFLVEGWEGIQPDGGMLSSFSLLVVDCGFSCIVNIGGDISQK